MPAETADANGRGVTLKGHAGLALRGRVWSVESPRAVVAIAHGLGEHGGAYGHVAAALGRLASVDVVAFDFRGHGLSPGRRGVVRDYDDLVGDLRGVLDELRADRPGLARFVLGHSNGGQVALRAALGGGLDASGLILSNPALRVAAPVPTWKLGLGRLLRRVAPGVTLTTEVDTAMLTRDDAMIALRRDDTLRHGRVNSSLFFGMLEGGPLLVRRAAEITIPILLILGEADPLIDARFTSDVFDRLGSGDKTRLVYPEMLHEPLNDVGRDAPLAAIARWLSDRIPPVG